MANEQGLFSVRRPRETLGGLNTNLTGIPMPASAMKRSNSNSNTGGRSMGGRMSLAPGLGMGRPAQPNFHRSSSGNNLSDMPSSSAKRQSMAPNMFSSSRKSFAPGIMATPAPAPAGLDLGSQRRSSVWSGARPSNGAGAAMGAHQSFFTTAPPAAAIPQDPRRLKDPSVRSQMAHELSEYLTRNNFEMDMKHSLTHKSFTSPTQKDFNCMFQWLYHRIDPSYRFQKNIDQEVPPLLKQMRYPFEKSIMKSQIAAVGGNNWSTFLGLLHWMMQLSQMIEHYASGAYDEACMEAGFDVTGDKIIFQFLTDAYRDWLQVDEDADNEDEADQVIARHVENMAAKFDDANAAHLEQVRVLEAEHQALQDQIDELGKNGPRIAKLDEQIKILEEDRIKFENYNNSMEAKVEKYQNRAKLLDDEIKKIEAELQEAEQDKTSLQAKVDEQGITIQDIDRMNTERERLQKNAESTHGRLEETRRRIAEKELEAAKKLDELERMVEKYNSRGYEIGIIPATAPKANGTDFELVLTLTEAPFNSSQMDTGSDRLLSRGGNGYQYHELLNTDTRRDLKNLILGLKKDIRDRMSAAQEADFENQEMLDKVKEAMDDKVSEVEALNHRVHAAEEEFEKTREITTAQKMASDTQIERMEKELAKMRAGLGESLQLLEQREMNINLQYDQMKIKAGEIREYLHSQIERILEDIIKWKIKIQEDLTGFEEDIDKQVVAQFEEQEAKRVEIDDWMDGVEY